MIPDDKAPVAVSDVIAEQSDAAFHAALVAKYDRLNAALKTLYARRVAVIEEERAIIQLVRVLNPILVALDIAAARSSIEDI